MLLTSTSNGAPDRGSAGCSESTVGDAKVGVLAVAVARSSFLFRRWVRRLEGFVMRIEVTPPPATCGVSATPLTPPSQFIDVDGLAQYTGIARATILSDLCRAPWKVPPPYRLPGRRKWLWDRDQVAAWIRRFPAFPDQMRNCPSADADTSPRRGRPRKAVPVRSRKPAVVELHLQGRG